MARKKAEAPVENAPVEVRIVPAPAPALQIQEPPSPDQLEKIASDRIRVRKAYVRLVARELRAQDVIVFGEEIYIPAKPCQDILSWAGIRVTPLGSLEEHRYPSPDGDFIVFEITVNLTDGTGREVPVTGNRSTRDEFFGIAGKDTCCPTCGKVVTWKKLQSSDKYDSAICPEHGKQVYKECKKVIRYLPLHDVDIASVRKAAITNLWNHAIKAVGLAPTLQDLEEAGMDISKVKRVDFSGGKLEPKKAPAGNSPTSQTAKAAPATQPTQQTGQQGQAKASTASQPASGVPKAVIPPTGKGTLESVVNGQTQPKKDTQGNSVGGGSAFLKLKLKENDQWLTLFDNMELEVDRIRLRAFELIRNSIGQPCAFTVVEVPREEKESFWNVKYILKIGAAEWLEDRTPVIQREPAQMIDREANPFPGDANEDIADEDLGF